MDACRVQPAPGRSATLKLLTTLDQFAFAALLRPIFEVSAFALDASVVAAIFDRRANPG